MAELIGISPEGKSILHSIYMAANGQMMQGAIKQPSHASIFQPQHQIG